jgi:hypothetical protein
LFACGIGAAAAPVQPDGYLHSSFREIHARAMVIGATTLGGAYDQSLQEGKTASALAMMFRTCARRYPAAAAGDYMLVGFVRQDGRIANTQVGPASDLAVCFGRAERICLPATACALPSTRHRDQVRWRNLAAGIAFPSGKHSAAVNVVRSSRFAVGRNGLCSGARCRPEVV